MNIEVLIIDSQMGFCWPGLRWPGLQEWMESSYDFQSDYERLGIECPEGTDGFKRWLEVEDQSLDTIKALLSMLPGQLGQALLSPGELYIDGAEEDCERAAIFLRWLGRRATEVTLSIDTHDKMHIAHPMHWEYQGGEHPKPFSTLSGRVPLQHVSSGTPNDGDSFKRDDRSLLTTSVPEMYEGSQSHVSEQEPWGRLTVWPEHCLTGSFETMIWPSILDAVHRWQTLVKKPVTWIRKGQTLQSEQFGIFRLAGASKFTVRGARILGRMAKADRIYVMGQARSHCVGESLSQMQDYFQATFGVRNKLMSKVYLVGDCTRDVPSFEEESAARIRNLVNHGMKIVTTAEIMQEDQ